MTRGVVDELVLSCDRHDDDTGGPLASAVGLSGTFSNVASWCALNPFEPQAKSNARDDVVHVVSVPDPARIFVLTFISFVIPTAGRPDQLRETITSLSRIDHPDEAYEIIVVNDGEEPETRHVVDRRQGLGPGLVYVAQERAGAGAARNRGAQVARGDLLIFNDDDISVEPAHIAQHLAAQAAHGPSVVNGVEQWTPGIRRQLETTAFGRFQIHLREGWTWSPPQGPVGEPFGDPQGLVACNMSIPRDAFWALGGFDMAFTMGGAEDRDFGFRAQRAGYPLIRHGEMKLWHADPVRTFEDVCRREERYAQGIVLLATKYPETYRGAAFLVENAPILESDSSGARIKKRLKHWLSREVVLRRLHPTVGLLERSRAPQSAMNRVYSVLLGLYAFRGVRTQLAAQPEAAGLLTRSPTSRGGAERMGRGSSPQ